ncbi:MAG: XapX domain-containing protein [Elstera sp.]
MKPYLLSLGAGLLIGVIYSLLNVRSPAPPIIALAGLMGILIGEQIIPVAKHLLDGTAFSAALHHSQSKDHVFGALPGRDPQKPQKDATETPL